MQKPHVTLRITILILVTIANILLARYAALSISNVPGVVTFYFAVAFMIAFTFWFGAWGTIAAYVGCLVGSGIPAGLPLQVNLYWSLADLWQVLIPLVAFWLLKADVGLRSKKDFTVFAFFGLFLNNLAGALWGSGVFVLSGKFLAADFAALFSNWFLGNLIVTVLITPLMLRFVTPFLKKKGLFVPKF